MTDFEPMTFNRLDEIEIKLSLKAWITENDGFDGESLIFEDGSTLTPKLIFEYKKKGKTFTIELEDVKKLLYSVGTISTEIDTTDTPCEYE